MNEKWKYLDILLLLLLLLYTRFQTKKAQKPYPSGRYTPE